MARTISASETIDRPADEVWAVLTDWPNAVHWMNGIESMSIDGETVEGARVQFSARGQDRESVIAQCEPGRSVTLQSRQGGVTADYRYSIEPVGESSCLVSLEADCQFSGLPFRLLGPLIGFAIRRTDGGQIAALKRVIEGE
ncbi:MAG: SRPBCC family protein [Chloroflexi bacterium]|nr:SRPBCC family protein [Chloroflexota bacterium]MCY3589446.1 SRPBCC family protein [Chloroflexota bacterium]MCY3685006.1 SRPBCC family protein [Chloroflexota bacterium]MDE2707660.1 SRPBCC family protein [Chloroflexota bacterium]